jgi:beta-glucanase (GH16 family)
VRATLRLAVVGCSFWTLAVCGDGPTRAQSPAGPSASEGWTVRWSDEFEAADGTRPDAARWVHDLGGGGWGNQELQTYTDRAENAVVRAGALVITARAERVTGVDGITRDYTSARLKTKDRFAQTYGRFEARIQVPRGQGMWPAFWMLGVDIDAAGWPACGEIDIMEHIGREPTTIHGTLHGPGYSGSGALSTSTKSPNGALFADGYHLYAVEWEPREIRWYLDGVPFAAKGSSDLPAGARWVFDHEFFLLLNLAVGGRWPGSPDSSTRFPQEMKVDYVRVYTRG